jgi:hypothetical protein
MLICGNQSAMGKEIFTALTASKVLGPNQEDQNALIEEMK